jgi:hypothetical protein
MREPILVINTPDRRKISVYILNPGECFPRWGGSQQSLLVEKTPSLITREEGPGGTLDKELNVNDPEGWRVIRYCINHGVLAP